MPHTRARLHSVKRRCAVDPDGPKPGGSCRQVQPVVATNTIAASTSRSPYRRRPPPCGRTGAAGTTRWNNSHKPSGTRRPTIAITAASLVITPVETISNRPSAAAQPAREPHMRRLIPEADSQPRPPPFLTLLQPVG